MKIDRLLGITIYLLNHGRTSARNLAVQFEVSPRTIMRDIDTLCIAGIPVTSNCGIDGGYEILDTFKMNSQLGGAKDYEYAVTALQALSTAFSNKDIEATFEKVKSLASDEANGLIMDLSVVREKQNINETLHTLYKIIKKKKQVRFQYTNANNEIKNVVAEPVVVEYKWYNWYLIAYNQKHQSYCMYKLIRMDLLEMLDKEHSKVHSITEAEKVINESNNNRNKISVKLFCDKSIRNRCLEYLNGTITREYDNGDFEYEITVPEEEQFWYGVLLSFGKDAKVIGPEELKDRILTNCRQIIEIYMAT